MKNNEISLYLENISILVLGIALLAFPLIFTGITTDPFSISKQALLGGVAIVGLILWGVKTISEGTVRIRRTPFDIPIILFTVMILLPILIGFFQQSFSINRFDALMAAAPLLFTVIFYFLIVQFVRTKQAIFFVLSCLMLGAVLTAIVAILSFFKVYILPIPFTHVQSFSTIGVLLDQAIYLALVVPVGIYFAWPMISYMLTTKDKSSQGRSADEFSQNNITMPIGSLFTICTLVILAGVLVSGIQLVTTQKPAILPVETGFQTGFAEISQDSGRLFQGFLFGSGFGTYATDFTRFKLASFNLNQTLWSLTFLRSTTYVLDLLATTGVLGIVAFLFLIVRLAQQLRRGESAAQNPSSIALVLAILVLFFAPVSFIIQTLFFVLIALYSCAKSLGDYPGFFEVELYFTARKSIVPSFISLENGELPNRHPKIDHSFSKFLPIANVVIIMVFAAFMGYFSVMYVASDITFQNSLIAASNNNGLQTYNNQVNAINMFPYRDGYQRVYSQTNIALANSIAASQPKGSSPSAQVQQTIYQLIQQSINSARNATTISPLTVSNWTNLASVYQTLIGVGQNAEQFAIVAEQQAITLDPNNPQNYIALGGIYYQLGQWDNAIRQFQIAVNLKPDLANAYYNLGHALEQKGDYQDAVNQYQQVQALTTSDAAAQKKIAQEITAVKQKMGAMDKTQTNQQDNQQQAAGQQPSELNISTPAAQLPAQKNPVKIPQPPTGQAAHPSPTPTK